MHSYHATVFGNGRTTGYVTMAQCEFYQLPKIEAEDPIVTLGPVSVCVNRMSLFDLLAGGNQHFLFVVVSSTATNCRLQLHNVHPKCVTKSNHYIDTAYTYSRVKVICRSWLYMFYKNDYINL